MCLHKEIGKEVRGLKGFPMVNYGSRKNISYNNQFSMSSNARKTGWVTKNFAKHVHKRERGRERERERERCIVVIKRKQKLTVAEQPCQSALLEGQGRETPQNASLHLCNQKNIFGTESLKHA
ncbi:hypothetical protein CsSME_00044028 [Camellia sinensis var. sinensis]